MAALNLRAVFKDAPAGAQKLGVIGWPLDHTLSPAMHNAAIKALGLNAVYRAIPLPPDVWIDFVAQAKELPLRGFNVTIPHKETVVSGAVHRGVRIDASNIGLTKAANTMDCSPSAWVAHNTDVGGLHSDIVENRIPTGDTVVVLGAGGAARAALAAFRTMAHVVGKISRIWVLNRTLEKAESLIREFKDPRVPVDFGAGELSNSRSILSKASLLVNATSLGLREGDPSPVEEGCLHPGLVVYDMIYHRETALMKAARAKGAKVYGGLGMLVHQGARAFEIWFNRKPPVEIMRKAAEDELKRRQT